MKFEIEIIFYLMFKCVCTFLLKGNIGLHLQLTNFEVFYLRGLLPSFIYFFDFHLKSLNSEEHLCLRLLKARCELL